uniref:Uncharacterized protein n=1 Tax=Vespula pensylvanica TaxID=30213 RepID=A0A834NQL3_VESPE|nr:hypothetical protein H0235_012323 [Vespula pensylvanica]
MVKGDGTNETEEKKEEEEEKERNNNWTDTLTRHANFNSAPSPILRRRHFLIVFAAYQPFSRDETRQYGSFIGELLSPRRELVCEPSRCTNVLTFIETPWWKESNGYRSQIFGLLGVFEKTNEWTKRGAA